MSLLEQLIAFLAELERVRDGRIQAIDFDGKPLEPFEDEDYVYLEVDLPAALCSDIELSVHHTRAFFRMERPPDGAKPALDKSAATHGLNVIGAVEFVEKERAFHAVLSEDGKWTCDGAADVADMLNHDLLPKGDPTHPNWGHEVVIEAARRLHGFAWLGRGRPMI